jgi:NADPH:quinone reductase-like Zn-dependent oxidoreductase
MFALQFARSAGARVLATSSNDEKLQRVRAMGASEGINYKRTPEWNAEVMKATGGRGVDCVVEVGGAGTLARSYQSIASGGKIVLIGVLTGVAGDTSPYAMMLKGGNLHGVFVGTREMFEQMNAAIELNHIKPVIDKVFPFDAARDAYLHQASGNFMGKVVIRI